MTAPEIQSSLAPMCVAPSNIKHINPLRGQTRLFIDASKTQENEAGKEESKWSNCANHDDILEIWEGNCLKLIIIKLAILSFVIFA